MKWFKPDQTNNSKKNLPLIYFSKRPLGLILNSVAKELIEERYENLQYVQIGLTDDDNFLVIKPASAKDEHAFVLTANSRRMYVGSRSLLDFGVKSGFISFSENNEDKAKKRTFFTTAGWESDVLMFDLRKPIE